MDFSFLEPSQWGIRFASILTVFVDGISRQNQAENAFFFLAKYTKK